MFFDTHTHLNDPQFDADRDQVLQRAGAVGVGQVVEIADAPADWDKAVALSRARPSQVRCSLGLHPYHADQFSDRLLLDLEKKIRLPEVVAVGEIGLDYVKSTVSREVQLDGFARVLSSCRDWKMPAVVHCRGAYEDLRAVIGRVFSGPPSGRRFWGVVHCFSGDEADAAYCIEKGFALGVDGPVTYPKNDSLRHALKRAGADALVLETDSPYLPPQSARGKRNEPSAIPEIAAKLAESLELPLSALAAKTRANGEELYRWRP